VDKIFAVVDKTGREIHLSKERWLHIRLEHPKITDYEEIENALKFPTKMVQSDRDVNVQWYYMYKKQKRNYLMVSVKYLNGHGYVITAFHTNKIQ